MDSNQREWRGSPLDMEGVMPYEGIREVVIEFESGDTDVFRPKQREEFHSYELSQMAAYLEQVVLTIATGRRR